jgi:hypothetical protein
MLRTILKVFILFFVIMSFIAFGGQYSKFLCKQSGYTCMEVKRGQTWESLWPDKDERRIIMRLNRKGTQLYAGVIIAVPTDYIDDSSYMQMAPFPETIEPSTRTTIIVDIDEQAFAAYDRAGYLIHWGPVSTARGWCPDIERSCNTPRGTFYFYSKGGPGCYSTIYPVPYGGAPMPYCMYFHNGFALHGSDEMPGYNASHGCVRLFYEDAQWLNQNFVELGRVGTKVIIK